MARGAFLDDLEVEHLNDGRWKVKRAFRYWSAIAGGIVRVPAGFITDFASVPRAPLIFWLFAERAIEAAVVHDWLYSTQRKPRRHADAVFREACAFCRPPETHVRRWVMFAALRLFGWAAWRASQREGLIEE